MILPPLRRLAESNVVHLPEGERAAAVEALLAQWTTDAAVVRALAAEQAPALEGIPAQEERQLYEVAGMMRVAATLLGMGHAQSSQIMAGFALATLESMAGAGSDLAVVQMQWLSDRYAHAGLSEGLHAIARNLLEAELIA